jgi:hypothetical protein
MIIKYLVHELRNVREVWPLIANKYGCNKGTWYAYIGEHN